MMCKIISAMSKLEISRLWSPQRNTIYLTEHHEPTVYNETDTRLSGMNLQIYDKEKYNYVCKKVKNKVSKDINKFLFE